MSPLLFFSDKNLTDQVCTQVELEVALFAYRRNLHQRGAIFLFKTFLHIFLSSAVLIDEIPDLQNIVNLSENIDLYKFKTEFLN